MKKTCKIQRRPDPVTLGAHSPSGLRTFVSRRLARAGAFDRHGSGVAISERSIVFSSGWAERNLQENERRKQKRHSSLCQYSPSLQNSRSRIARTSKKPKNIEDGKIPRVPLSLGLAGPLIWVLDSFVNFFAAIRGLICFTPHRLFLSIPTCFCLMQKVALAIRT